MRCLFVKIPKQKSCTSNLRGNILISKQQKFWNSLSEYLGENPGHPLAALIQQGKEMNLKYVTYYENLAREFHTPEELQKQLIEKYHNAWGESIRQKAGNDEQSRCGVYLLVNPGLTPPKQRNNILEWERILITRYRCGSHNLRIETGRLCNPSIPRIERYCSCSTDVQSLHHVLFDCPLIVDLHHEYAFTSIEEALNRDDVSRLLLKMERQLGICSSG